MIKKIIILVISCLLLIGCSDGVGMSVYVGDDPDVYHWHPAPPHGKPYPAWRRHYDMGWRRRDVTPPPPRKPIYQKEPKHKRGEHHDRGRNMF